MNKEYNICKRCGRKVDRLNTIPFSLTKTRSMTPRSFEKAEGYVCLDCYNDIEQGYDDEDLEGLVYNICKRCGRKVDRLNTIPFEKAEGYVCLVCYNDIEQGYGDFCSRCHKWYDIDDKYKWYTKDVDTDMVRICLKCLSIDFLLSFFYYPKGRKKE